METINDGQELFLIVQTRFNYENECYLTAHPTYESAEKNIEELKEIDIKEGLKPDFYVYHIETINFKV